MEIGTIPERETDLSPTLQLLWARVDDIGGRSLSGLRLEKVDFSSL